MGERLICRPNPKKSQCSKFRHSCKHSTGFAKDDIKDSFKDGANALANRKKTNQPSLSGKNLTALHYDTGPTVAYRQKRMFALL